MPKVSREHLDARRQQVLDAAAACFADTGFHRTTMQDIVRESGLSAGAIYCYFAGKDEIIQAIADDRHQREWRSILTAIDRDDAKKTLHQLSRRFFEPLKGASEKRTRRIGIEMWTEALHDSAVLETTREGVNKPLRLFEEALSAAQRKGELVPHLDPEAIGRVMIALFQGFILQQAWDDVDVEPFLAVIDFLVDALVSESP